MKRIILLFIFLILLLSIRAWAAINWYEDFEGETVDQPWPNASCEGQDTFYELWHSVDPYMPNCHNLIENDYTPRYGSQYLTLYCDWVNCDVMANSRRVEFIMAQDTAWSPCNIPKSDDDTEYWFGWSYYIPADYYVEKYSHQVFQVVSGNSTIQMLMYYGGDATNYSGRIRYNGTNYYPKWGNWVNDKGTWVDYVIHGIWHSTDDADAILELYQNGVLVMGADSDGKDNMVAGYPPTVGLPELYNQLLYPDIYNCEDTIKTWDTPMSRWRSVHIDEYRMTEDTKGTKNYCDVCAPIWAATPTITVPSQGQGSLATTFTAEFSGYSDHRTDAQACFSAYRMNVEVDEDGGDWGTLVYDSGDISTASSHAISGLSVDTNYQIRVRHSSYSAARSTEYWGEWSDTVTFTTASTDVGPSEGNSGEWSVPRRNLKVKEISSTPSATEGE